MTELLKTCLLSDEPFPFAGRHPTAAFYVYLLCVRVFMYRIAQMGGPKDTLLVKMFPTEWNFIFSGRWLQVIS